MSAVDGLEPESLKRVINSQAIAAIAWIIILKKYVSPRKVIKFA
jgi:hypothetical protein